MKYCEATYQTIRRKTREVLVGHIGIGGDNPIRIQSMTTSNTRDVDATVDQIIRLADHGCEIARVTVQGMKEAKACEEIKNKLIQKNYTIPLVADIHFFPPAAMQVIDFVEKVRINPGNYVDKRASFKVIEYDEGTYQRELEKIYEKFSPLVLKAKALKKAIRIGTNHGSLSDRIMNRYGDTPLGMVESALEFGNICRMHDFHDFIFSMKASNTAIMIQAYRLLCARMYALNWDYPLHLGVTEAGEGEDGRIKSAIGIGSLLLDGIGDTIRVSLTEDPWYEIEPCKKLIKIFEKYEEERGLYFENDYRNIESIERREVEYPKKISMHKNGTVFLNCSTPQFYDVNFIKNIGCQGNFGTIKLNIDSADGIITEGHINEKIAEKGISFLSKNSFLNSNLIYIIPLNQVTEYTKINNEFIIEIGEEPRKDWFLLKKLNPSLIIFSPSIKQRIHQVRKFISWLHEEKLQIPVILSFDYSEKDLESFILNASAEIGSLLCDGLGEGILIKNSFFNLEKLRLLSFGILQGCRMRTVKTEFISCPSCGRTLFDLQEVTQKIKERTSHLPGVKIAIMGCIVNGPGEMADADFGYVGSSPGKIDLYIGKNKVEKEIDFKDAVDRLIELIKSHNKWMEPEIVFKNSEKE